MEAASGAPLRADHIGKSYSGTVWALRGLSLAVSGGEIVGVLGENGAGKTTAIRILTGLLRPSEGTVHVNGERLDESPAKLRSRIGVLFGAEPGLYGKLTGRENIAYFAGLNGLDRKTTDRGVTELAEKLDCSAYIDRRSSRYSTGMKQKVALARTVIHRPDILIFDEPTSGLDVVSTELVHRFLHTQREEGRAIVISSHSTDEVERLCDRIVVLRNGVEVARGAPQTISHGVPFRRWFLSLQQGPTADRGGRR
jgi:sodium transport system ATP-binding protein